MSTVEPITLFHAPQSRSAGVLTLLEELAAPYEIVPINIKVGEQRQPEYLAINPLGKVPDIRHRGILVTEQVAIYIYLADVFPEAGFAPGIDDPLRGPYLRWLVFYAACFEPALVDKALKREPAPLAMSPYGGFDVVISTLEDRLRAGPYLLGGRLTVRMLECRRIRQQYLLTVSTVHPRSLETILGGHAHGVADINRDVRADDMFRSSV